ncbi:MAG: hypothetical protein GF355_17160 [Candidatus Eisenbacteria bacterium]|nr:hypothetical protein [Candidatus Eisenbacteria bacterium]
MNRSLPVPRSISSNRSFTILRGLAVLTLLAASTGAAGQSFEGSWWTGFGYPGVLDSGGEEDVRAVVRYQDRLVIGGQFDMAGGDPSIAHLAVWDGVNWAGLGTGVDAQVHALAVFEGDLIAAGDFTTAGDQTVDYIARWDGSAWHDIGGGMDAPVLALAVHDEFLVAAGRFQEAGGQPAAKIAFWDGQVWWQPGAGLDPDDPNTWARALTIYNGDLIAGGDFYRSENDVHTRKVARWDGNQWQPLGPGLDLGQVYALGVYNEELYAGGSFEEVYGGSFYVRHIARWDGEAWHTVGAGSEEGVDDHVYALAAYGDRLMVGGVFEQAGSVPCQRLAGWDGTVWWDACDGGLNGRVSTLELFDGDLLAGGRFSGTRPWGQGGHVMEAVGRWDGETWHGYGRGANGPAYAWADFDGRLVAAGEFDHAGATPVGYLATFDGEEWHALGELDSVVDALAYFQGELYAGGAFSWEGDVHKIARWDGSAWVALDPEAQPNQWVTELIVRGDSLIVAGRFDLIGSEPFDRIAAWDGTAWHHLGGGFDGYITPHVHALANAPDGLLAGGHFTEADGQPAAHLALWDGYGWSEWGGGTDDDVYALAVYEGQIVAGGAFDLAGGDPVSHVALWKGDEWDDLGGGADSTVYALEVYNQTLIAGGKFRAAGTAAADRIARWTGNEWVPLQEGTDGPVHSLYAFENRLYAGGDFDIAGGAPSYHFARWMDACLPDTTFFEEMPHYSLGCATLDKVDTTLVVGQLGAEGYDGVQIDIPAETGWAAELEIPTPLEAGSYLQLFVQGEVDGAPGTPVGDLQATRLDGDDPQIEINIGLYEGDSLRYTFYLQGFEVFSYAGPAAPIQIRPVGIGDYSLMCDAAEAKIYPLLAAPAISAGWSDTVLVDVDGVVHLADEIEVQPLNVQSSYEVLTETFLFGMGMASFTLREETLASETAGAPPGRPDLADAPVLGPGFPSPFSNRVTIVYRLPRRGPVCLDLFDLQGRLVRRLVARVQDPGPHRVVWDGRSSRGKRCAPGLYFARLRAPGGERSLRILHIR